MTGQGNGAAVRWRHPLLGRFGFAMPFRFGDKVALSYAGLRFTDYLTIMQFDDAWKILNKAYHHD